jgi:hypothetical protein
MRKFALTTLAALAALTVFSTYPMKASAENCSTRCYWLGDTQYCDTTCY